MSAPRIWTKCELCGGEAEPDANVCSACIELRQVRAENEKLRGVLSGMFDACDAAWPGSLEAMEVAVAHARALLADSGDKT